MSHILEATGLKKYYGSEPNVTKALNGVDLSIEQGGIRFHHWNIRKRKIYTAAHAGRIGCANVGKCRHQREGNCQDER